MRSRPGWVDSEVYFRIVHLAHGGHRGAPVATYREQTVEIALGPKGAFENGNIGALSRRVLTDPEPSFPNATFFLQRREIETYEHLHPLQADWYIADGIKERRVAPSCQDLSRSKLRPMRRRARHNRQLRCLRLRVNINK